jgi:hypothetical protein
VITISLIDDSNTRCVLHCVLRFTSLSISLFSLQLAAGLSCSVIVVDTTSDTKEGKEAASRLSSGKWETYDPSANQKIVETFVYVKPAPAGAAAGAGAEGGSGEAGAGDDAQVSGVKRKAGGAVGKSPAAKRK